MKFKEILCPTDFSEFSRNALDYATALARWYGAKVTVLHVVPRYLIHPDQFPYAAEPLTPPEDFQQYARRELLAYVEGVGAKDVSVEGRLLEGDTVEAILSAANEQGSDLIVMGTHGRRGFEKFILGSVTEKVLRKANCPVLTVTHAPQLDGDGLVHFRAMLMPVDFSTTSAKASEYAFSIAHETQTPLFLLNVVADLTEPDSAIQWSDSLEIYRERLQKDAAEHLRKMIPEVVRARLKIEEQVDVGRSYERILAFAEEKEVDLIVMGIRGRSALNMVVFGSTTNHVVRASSCPVLTIRTA